MTPEQQMQQPQQGQQGAQQPQMQAPMMPQTQPYYQPPQPQPQYQMPQPQPGYGMPQPQYGYGPPPQALVGGSVLLPVKIQLPFGGSVRCYRQFEVPANVPVDQFIAQLVASGAPVDVYGQQQGNGYGGGGNGYNGGYNGGGGRY